MPGYVRGLSGQNLLTVAQPGSGRCPSPFCKFCGVGERPVTLDQEVRVGQACPGDDEAGPAEQQLVGAEFDAEQVVPQEACGVVGPVAAVAVVEERRAVALLV